MRQPLANREGSLVAVIFHDRTHLARACAAFALALACVFGALMPQPAYAAVQRGTLSVRCVTERDGASVVLAGDTYTLALVATASVSWDGGAPSVAYAPAAGFEAYDYTWGSLDADALRAAAHELDEHARTAGLYTAGEATSNQAGVAAFGWLDPGLYLVARTSVAAGNASYTCDPMLISVPAMEDGSLVYRVVAEPKFEWSEPPATPPHEPPTPDDEKPPAPTIDDVLTSWGLPATGDPAFWVGTGFMLLGLVLAAAGIILSRRSGRSSGRDPTARR